MLWSKKTKIILCPGSSIACFAMGGRGGGGVVMLLTPRGRDVGKTF